jgi:hypothetical protein
MMITRHVLTIGCGILLLSGALFSIGNTTLKQEETKKVEAAIRDYVEGIYQADTTRIYRSVHPELRKRGYYFRGEEKGYTGKLEMSFEQLVKLTTAWNKDGENANENSPKEITVYEVLDKTASGKVVAEWGIDYFHLAKLDGKWYIMNVLWQSPPR